VPSKRDYKRPLTILILFALCRCTQHCTDAGSLSERQHESRKLQIKSINFLAADVAQHQRGIVRG
jgi:hypothetical protein